MHLKMLIFVQHPVKKKTGNHIQHTAPNSASRRDALTVEPVRQIQDFRKTIDL